MHPISIAAEELFKLFSWLPVTNALLTTWLAMVVVLVIAFLATRKMSAVPSGVQNLMELAIEGGIDVVQGITGDKKQTKEFFPLVFTIFFLVLFCNWLGLIPGVGSLGFFEMENGHESFLPLFRGGSSDLSFTFALATIVMIWVQVIGAKHLHWHYLGKFFNFSSVTMFFVGLLELVLEFAKIISFSFRLFGNVFAGEVLLAVMIFLVPYIIPVPFYGLEIFVGLIQAFIFAMLTLVFSKMATVHHE